MTMTTGTNDNERSLAHERAGIIHPETVVFRIYTA